MVQDWSPLYTALPACCFVWLKRLVWIQFSSSGKEKEKFLKNENKCKILVTETATYGTKYSRMDEVKFFKGCLSQILRGPFLNTLPHIIFHTGHFLDNNNFIDRFDNGGSLIILSVYTPGHAKCHCGISKWNQKGLLIKTINQLQWKMGIFRR